MKTKLLIVFQLSFYFTIFQSIVIFSASAQGPYRPDTPISVLDKSTLMASSSSYLFSPMSPREWISQNVIDDNTETVWCAELPQEEAIGQWVQLNFPTEKRISRLDIINGSTFSEELYQKDGRPKTLKVVFSDDSSQTIHLADTMEKQVFRLYSPPTRFIRLIIEEQYPGEHYWFTCISEIDILTVGK